MRIDLPEMAGHPVGDKGARQRYTARSIWITVPGTYVLIGAAYAILPPLDGLEETSARLVLAVRWLLVAMVPYAAVCITILSARFFEGAHNLLVGGESDHLKIQCRVMQNTLRRRPFRVLVGISEERHTWASAGRTAHIFAEHLTVRACIGAVRKTPSLMTTSATDGTSSRSHPTAAHIVGSTRSARLSSSKIRELGPRH